MRARGVARARGWGWVAGGALLLLLGFLVYPTFRLAAAGLGGTTYLREFFQKAYYYRALFNSVWLSVAATLGSVLIGVPLAVLTVRYDVPGKGFVRAAALLSLLSPPFIGAYAWVILLGRSGVLTRLLGLHGFSIYGAGGVLLVFILHHFAYPFFLTAAALGRIDPALEEAAETLGATPLRRLFTVTLPLALPSILAGALLVFTTTLADFGTPMLIGEGLRTLPVLAYSEYLSELGGSPGMASVSSMLMLAVALSALALQTWAVGGRSYAMQAVARPKAGRLSGGRKWAAAVLAWLPAAAAALPQATVLVASCLRSRGAQITGELTLENYRLLTSRMAGPIWNTLGFSVTAALIMLAGGLLIGYLLVRRPGLSAHLVDGLLIFAQILPGTVLGIGLLVAYGKPPLLLSGTAAVLIIAYVVRRIAFTVRAAAAGLRQLSPTLEEASLTLGAPPARTFLRITVPLMLPAAISGALLSWVSTLTELSATIMLYTGRTATVSIQIYNQVLTDSFGTAAALGSVLTLLTLLSLGVLRRFSDTPVGLEG